MITVLKRFGAIIKLNMGNSDDERILVLKERLLHLERELTDFAKKEMLDEDEETCNYCEGLGNSESNRKNCFEVLNVPYLKSFFLQRLKGEGLHGFVALAEGRMTPAFEIPDFCVNKMLLGDYNELMESIDLVRKRTYDLKCPIGEKVEGKIRRILYLVPAGSMDYRLI